MDSNLMIKKLKAVGISFDEGLTDDEFTKIESTLGFRFPSEIRAFLACGIPVGSSFYNWRDLSDANIQRFRNFRLSIEDSFLFDIVNNPDDLRAMLSDQFPEIADQEAFSKAVLNFLHESTKLIPFYAHRCFFDGADNMPIVSFWQPTDTIFYGENFEDYLETEFLGKKRSIKQIPEQIKDMGIWYYLIE
jgi:hypothetical protein